MEIKSKVLFVGDVHARPSDLDECDNLMTLIESTAKKYSVDHILFAGDLFHTHNIVNIDVMDFWIRALKHLSDSVFRSDKGRVICLVGNHDRKHGDEPGSPHALMTFDDSVLVVDEPTQISGKIWAMPYYYSLESFEDNFPFDCKTVFCHQTFEGAKYDNGFYATDGVPLEAVQGVQIISGHIHTAIEFENVLYPGSPRWMSLSDANQEKFIYVFEFEDGVLVNRNKVPTNPLCEPIYSVKDTPDNQADVPNIGITNVDIHGPQSYINKRVKELKAKGVTRIRTFPDKDRFIQVKESEGMVNAFSAFLESYIPRYNTEMEVLRRMVKERITWMG